VPFLAFTSLGISSPARAYPPVDFDPCKTCPPEYSAIDLTNGSRHFSPSRAPPPPRFCPWPVSVFKDLAAFSTGRVRQAARALPPCTRRIKTSCRAPSRSTRRLTNKQNINFLPRKSTFFAPGCRNPHESSEKTSRPGCAAGAAASASDLSPDGKSRHGRSGRPGMSSRRLHDDAARSVSRPPELPRGFRRSARAERGRARGARAARLIFPSKRPFTAKSRQSTVDSRQSTVDSRQSTVTDYCRL